MKKHKKRVHPLSISIISTAIVAIVLSFLLLFENYTSAKIKQSYQSIYSNNIEAYYDSVYKDAQMLKNISLSLQSNYNVLMIENAFDLLDEPAKQEYYVEIISTLKTFQSISSLINQIDIYFKSQKLLINSNGVTKNQEIAETDSKELFYSMNNKIVFGTNNQNENVVVLITLDNNVFFAKIGSFIDINHDNVFMCVGTISYNNNLNNKSNLSYQKDEYGIRLKCESFSSEIKVLNTLYSIIFLSLFIIGIAACMTSIYIVKQQGTKVFEEISIGFKELEKQNYSYRIYGNFSKEGQRLMDSFNNMCEQLQTYFNINYRQEVLLKEAENKKLQSQINPHFLHNTYFFLRKEIMSKKYDEAEEFAFNLSQFFKYITNPKDYVELYQEYEHALNYLNIQNKRLNNRIMIKFDYLENKYKSIMVPYLIIEPIIENSFKYVFEKNIHSSTLTIKIYEKNDHLYINIEDSGVISDENYNNVLKTLNDPLCNETFSCLKNIKTRLNYINGDLMVYRSATNGLGVILDLGGICNV